MKFLDYWDFNYWGPFFDAVIPIIEDPLYLVLRIFEKLCHFYSIYSSSNVSTKIFKFRVIFFKLHMWILWKALHYYWNCIFFSRIRCFKYRAQFGDFNHWLLQSFRNFAPPIICKDSWITNRYDQYNLRVVCDLFKICWPKIN